MKESTKKLHVLAGLFVVLMVCTAGSVSGQIKTNDLYVESHPLSQHKESSMVPLSNVLKKLEQTNHITFLYQPGLIEGKKVSKIVLTAMGLADKIGKLLAQNGLTYEKQAKGIYVIKRLPMFRGMRQPAAAAQVNGTVTDASTGKTLPGVNIKVQGTTTGTATDANGQYELTVESLQDTLVFSFVGYKTLQVPINGRTEVNVEMQSQAITGQEMVVVGYGTQKKENVTGSVSTVGASELGTMPAANVGSRLQGHVSGVTVINNNSPGGAPTIRIHGYGSINGNNPLYVVDGVPISGGLDNINPNNIESISVLKDAASAAIYGARAANGVVLITTKHGKPGEAKVSLSIRYGIQNYKNNLENQMLSPMQAAQLTWLAFKNDGLKVGDPGWGSASYGNGPTPVLPDYVLPVGAMDGDPSVNPSLYSWPRPYYGIIKANKTGTDWFKVINHKNAPTQNYNLGVSGGTKGGSNYRFSVGYKDQQGTVLYTDYKRYSLRLNTEAKIGNGKWLTVGETVGASYSNRLGFANQTDLNPIAMAARTGTINPVYDIKGHFAGGYNPLWLLYTNRYNYNKNIRALGNAYAQVDVLKDFTLKTLFGLDYSNSRNQDRALIQYQSPDAAAANRLTQTYNGGLEYNWTNTLTYRKTIKNNHNVKVLLGSEVESDYSENISAGRGTYPFTTTTYMVLNAGEQNQTSGGAYNRWLTFSYFGRLNYNYKEKYLFKALVRRDGSSRFTAANRWGTFPAFSVGWRISKEPFMDNVSWVNDLKIRGGFGENGNDNVGDYNIYTTYRSNIAESYYNITGSNHTSSEAGFHEYKRGNSDARWESTKTYDIGVDATVFKNNLDISFDLYWRKTSDMLYPASLPATYGQVIVPSINIGDMLNTGFDLTLTYHGEISKDFSFSITGNASHNKNEVLKLNGNPDEILHGSTLRDYSYTASKAGHPISSFYGYKVEGIFNTQKEVDNWPKYNPDKNGNDTYSRPGVFKFKDVNGDGKITSADRTFIGKPLPDLTYGFTIRLNYKNWDLNIFSHGVMGKHMINFAYWNSFSGLSEKRTLTQSWTAERYKNGDKITVPIVSRNETIEHLPSSFFVENASYFRIKSLELGYTLPSKVISKLSISGLRIFIQATNVLTITPYTGLDPEVDPINNLTLGVDNSVYPTPQNLMLGLDMHF